MLLNFLLYFFVLSILLMLLLFYFNKFSKMESLSSSSFECGFSSYYYSRFSFSIHFFLVAMIFIFLDLEICLLLPFFNEWGGGMKESLVFLLMVTVLLIGLVQEWVNNKIEWFF